jgi:hypothetical protein
VVRTPNCRTLFGELTVTEDLDTPLAIPRDLRIEGESKFALAKSWINQSVSLRDLYSGGSFPPLPSRVLDVGGDGIRLHISQPREMGPYITLSYRWGDSDLFQTTRENFDAHCKRIALEDLPRTLYDAVVVAKKMGIRYLWIDALCIIQGEEDAADWKTEAPFMGHIYRNSLFTIAAHCAKDRHDGFLRQALEAPPLRQVQIPVRESATSKIRRVKSWMRIPGNFQWLIVDGPLSRRGWIFQERILSKRILYFAKCELFWEDPGTGLRGEYGSLYNSFDELGKPNSALYKPDLVSFTVKD